MPESTLIAAFSVGLAGAGHCLGMCGGIAAALGLGSAGGPATLLSYHAGRLASYTMLGALAGLLAASVDTAAWTLALRYIAGLLLVAMGLYIADWWRGLQWLERLGARAWRPVQGLAARWLPPRHPRHGFALGLCWGMMPCGLIYSALALAATRQDGLQSGLMMLCFGLGTLPAMLGSSLGGARLRDLLRRRAFKLVIAVLLLGSGLWTLYMTASHSAHLLQASEGSAAGHHHQH